MKLLSVSRSFVNSRNQQGRYKMAEQGVLPKFAPMGRPVSLAPKGKADELLLPPVPFVQTFASARSSTKPVNSIARPRLRQSDAATSSRVQPLTVTLSPQESACVNAVPISTNFFRLRKNPFVTRSAEKPRSALQTPVERSLDAVKVVRNDLSDADLEVIPAQPESKTGDNRVQRPRFFRAELTGLAWSRLTARFFNSERARV